MVDYTKLHDLSQEKSLLAQASHTQILKYTINQKTDLFITILRLKEAFYELCL